MPSTFCILYNSSPSSTYKSSSTSVSTASSLTPSTDSTATNLSLPHCTRTFRIGVVMVVVVKQARELLLFLPFFLIVFRVYCLEVAKEVYPLFLLMFWVRRMANTHCSAQAGHQRRLNCQPTVFFCLLDHRFDAVLRKGRRIGLSACHCAIVY
uniref:Uncharacterized protein n=1 Tax=Schistocephalus solidus TaxID=70667 RepID=A0A0X3P7I7_SCHSO